MDLAAPRVANDEETVTMTPTTLERAAVAPDDARADELRSQMYADREFMAAIRTGYDDGLRGRGIPVDDYFKGRGIN